MAERSHRRLLSVQKVRQLESQVGEDVHDRPPGMWSVITWRGVGTPPSTVLTTVSAISCLLNMSPCAILQVFIISLDVSSQINVISCSRGCCICGREDWMFRLT